MDRARWGPVSWEIVRAILISIACAPLLAGACETQPGGGDPPAADPDAGTADFELDLFGVVGHELRFEVSPEQAMQMEDTRFDPGGEDQYEIGSGTYADDLVVTDRATGGARSFGRVELRLVGESSFRPWNRIPNLRVDMDEFEPGQTLDGIEHFRLNNGQVGGIYREAIALRVWAALGYHVPRASHDWVRAPNQWGEQVRVPYTLVEVYKPDWCARSMPGGCANIWEAVGDIDSLPGRCQFDECEETRLAALIERLDQTSYGDGFAAALADFIDWDAYRSFQCLSWITATGDDYLHNNNNLVLAERGDGKFQLLPYSIDISAGQEWYPEVQLLGHSRLANGCQTDPACWAALLERCDQLLDEVEAMDPVASIVEPVIEGVARAGMNREGDQVRADQLRAWYGGRAAELRADPIWQQTPCLDDSTCADREDGKTVCYGVCVEPGSSCLETGCPDGYWCDEKSGQCFPF